MFILVLIVTQASYQISIRVVNFIYLSDFLPLNRLPDGSAGYEGMILVRFISLIIILFAMFIASRFIKSNWGFSLGNWKSGKKLFIILPIVWICLMVLLSGINYILPTDITKPPSASQAILGFLDSTFGPGIVEEIQFRAFTMTVLSSVFLGHFGYKYRYTSNDLVLSKNKKVKNPKKHEINFSISTATLISAAIFCLTHITYQIYPFKIIHINLAQLFIAFLFGLIFGVIFERMKSVYYGMLIHCIVDSIGGITILTTYLFSLR